MTVSSETTVSGSYAGVSAEEKVTAEFGVEKSTEESREQSEEGTKDESLGIAFTAAPRQLLPRHDHEGARGHVSAVQHRRRDGLRR